MAKEPDNGGRPAGDEEKPAHSAAEANFGIVPAPPGGGWRKRADVPSLPEGVDGRDLSYTMRREVVKRWRAQGYTVLAMAEALNVSERSIARDIAAIRQEAARLLTPETMADIAVDLDSRALDRVEKLHHIYDEAKERPEVQLSVVRELGREDDRLVARLAAFGLNYAEILQHLTADEANDENAPALTEEEERRLDEALSGLAGGEGESQPRGLDKA